MDVDSRVKIEVWDFVKVLWPILLSFLGSRVITQTDIVMLAPLGGDAVGAYSIPSRVMLIDTIIALALGPIVSVAVAKVRDIRAREQVVREVMSIGLYLGGLLTLIGLTLYPLLVDLLVDTQTIAVMATGAIVYLTLSIPVRMMQFIGQMALHGLGQGGKIVPIIFVSIFLNMVLNWFFIYQLTMGFTGCYIATVVTAVFELMLVIMLLPRSGSFTAYAKLPSVYWIKNILYKGGAEWGRLISYQLINLTLLAIFALNLGEEGGKLSVFAVAMELQAFLLMPMLAAMRSTAIVLATRNFLQSHLQVYHSLMNVALIGIVLIMLAGGILLEIDGRIWQSLYGITKQSMSWWQPFLVVIVLTIPVNFLNALQRGAWQSREKYGFLFAVDFLTQWLILIPSVLMGVLLNYPWLTWSGWFFVEIVVLLILYFGRKGLSLTDLRSDCPGIEQSHLSVHVCE